MHGLTTRGGEQIGKLSARNSPCVHAKQGGGGGIDLNDAVAARVYDRDGLAGELKQQAIALLRIAYARVFPLHTLLGVGEAALQRGERSQISPEHDQAHFAAEPHGAIAHRNVRPLGRRMVDLSPARRLTRPGFAQQFLDLRTSVGSDRVRPFAADPVPVGGLAEFGVGENHVENDAVAAHHQRDVRRRGDQRARGLCVDPGKMILGGFKCRVGR